MIIGYARTSTTDQRAGLEAQERDLRAAGVERLFREQVGATGHRKVLHEAMDYAREGDVLVVTRLDRLARSVADLVTITNALRRKKVGLRILSMNLDTTTPTGKLLLNLVGCIAEFERELMLERQREGIAKAKGEGKYKGRAPTARAKTPEILRLAAQGRTADQIAEELGIGRSSVFAILKEHRAPTPEGGRREQELEPSV